MLDKPVIQHLFAPTYSSPPYNYNRQHIGRQCGVGRVSASDPDHYQLFLVTDHNEHSYKVYLQAIAIAILG